MVTRGGKPKPTEVRRMEGNPGHRPMNDAEPEPESGAPEPPKFNSKVAADEWKWLCKTLGGMGILAKSDKALMVMYCDTWARYLRVRQEQDIYSTSEKGIKYLSACMMAEAMFKKQLVAYAAELGFSPTARTRIKVVGKKQSPKESKFFSRDSAKVVG